MASRSRFSLAFVAALSLPLTPAATEAQTAGGVAMSPAAAGRALAQRLCSGCHIIDPSGAGGAVTPVGPPSFPAIANKPGQTAERIKNVLILPHAPMPDMQLTNVEIVNIISYLETLRAGAGAPVEPEVEKPKPPART